MSVLFVGVIGFGFASGGVLSPGSTVSSTAIIEGSVASYAVAEEASLGSLASQTAILENATQRDVSEGVQEIADEEEAARLAAEEAARLDELEHIAQAEEAKALAAAKGSNGLGDVDFGVGKEAFIEEWTARIDAYLAGSVLEGYGALFAEAAWEYGVDPRWSPAISNTESSKGRNCFDNYNAWGWMGDESWSSWEEAIDAHVSNLAQGYGYTISLASAKKYCPPNYEAWYSNTLSEMAKI